jgi:hypothetical protein
VNVLVAGGLLVLGVLFLVALVFVIRSEPTIKESTSAPNIPDVPPPMSTEKQGPKVQSTTAIAPSPMAGIQSAPDKDASSVAENRPVGDWYPLANGQFYELVNELRSMHLQAQELEHRLAALVDMAQRVEQTQKRRFPGEEQAPSDTQSTH